MRIPQRRAQKLQARDDSDDGFYITAAGLERLKRELQDLLERKRPLAIEEVGRLAELGDFSENVEYQEAKHRLARMNTRILTLRDRIAHAIVINSVGGSDDAVQLGSTVVLEKDAQQKTYHLVGPRESNPPQGRISHLSPLGAALIGHRSGEEVCVPAPGGEIKYKIVDVS